MKVRWRQHEITLATILAVLLLASYLWNVHETAMIGFAGPFINNNVPFNIYKNVVIPQVGAGILIYLAYLFINLVTIRGLLFPKKVEIGTSKITVSFSKISLQGMVGKMIKRYAWLLIQLILIILLLGTAFNFGTYYLHQWQFNYTGFSIFFNKNNPKSQMDIFWGYAIASLLIFFYGLYICVREVIIHFIEKHDSRRGFRILICNQITTFLTNYLLSLFFLLTFHLVHEHDGGVGNFLFVISIFLVFMSNTYWLFPLKGESSFFRKGIIIRLLLSTFIYTVPFIGSFAFPGRILFVLFILWGIQLFITTPITWIVYQARKDKILALRGAQKALVKSNADLQFLRSQINPHFLFNVLNTLYGTALQENAQLTAESIQKLGDMMRFMLHENNLDFIPMEKEIDYLNNYISLQKLRTQSSPEIIIEDNIHDQNCNCQIAPMLFIPWVENAFKHGISLKEKSWIKINLDCNEGNIVFEVRNSMHPKNDNDPEKERSGIGFKNVVDRLKLIYPGKHQITVNADGKEFLVQLSIQP